MSTSDKPDLARGWRWAEKLVDEEADRIAAMSDEEFEREAAAMPDPEHIPTEEELDARSARRRAEQPKREAKPPAVVKPVPRRPSALWLVAAAFVALLVLIAVKRDELVALFRHQAPIVPLPSEERAPWQPPAVEVTLQERANALRVEAYAACGRASWDLCRSKLDEAKTLDPSGELDPKVRAARRELSVAGYPDAAFLPRDTKLAPERDPR